MNIAFIKVSDDVSIVKQQNELLRYIICQDLSFDKKIVEFASELKTINEREEIVTILNEKSLKHLFVYDLKSFSFKIGEIIYIFNSLLDRDVKIHLCNLDIFIAKESPTELTLKLLNELREENIARSNNKIGRPKGRVSKSKFDDKIEDILLMLKDNFTISEIARRLEVNRSSLRDFINSRNLKELSERYNFQKDKN